VLGVHVQTTQKWNIKDLKTIEWDAAWEECDDIWIAPLWMTPGHWKAPQGTSGEIDFMESCKCHWPRNHFGTSIICHDHPHPDCYEKLWDPKKSSNGVQHFTGKIHSQGTWTLHKTTESKTSPQLISRYPQYTEKITSLHDFSLMSDIFNGGAGDGGWHGCGQLNHGTKCRFGIANITVNLIQGAEESSSAYPCKDWCESDRSQGKNQGRHCAPGDMAHVCGGCSFCGR